VDKWLVKVTDAQLAGLRSDLRELGTLVNTDQGERYLMFHDSFVALKVASYLGLQRQAGRTVSGKVSKSSDYHPLVTFDNGDVLVTETRGLSS
jgi:hypothetical protein